MKKILIIYFSRTGNTETMAQLIHNELTKSSDVQVDIKTQVALKNWHNMMQFSLEPQHIIIE